MGIWKRLKRVVKANTNAALDKLDNPRTTLEFLEEDLKTEQKQIHKKLVEAITEEKRLEKNLQRKQETLQEWENKAIKAIKLGDDELAKQALSRKQSYQLQIEELEQEILLQKNALTELKQAEKELHRRGKELLSKRDVLLARLDGAEMMKSMSTEEDNSPFAEFERMSQKIEQEEIDVDLQKEMSSELNELDINRKLKELEQTKDNQDDLNDALASLKSRLNKK